MKSKSLYLLLLTTFALTGCGGNGGTTSSQATTVAPAPGEHEITEAEYNAALAAVNEGNVKATVLTSSTMGELSQEMTIYFEGTATKGKQVISMGEDSITKYISHEGEKYYGFAEFDSTWYKIEISKEEYDESRSEALVFLFDYDQLKFDTTTQKYVLKQAIVEEDEGATLTISKADHSFTTKKLQSVEFSVTESEQGEEDIVTTGSATYDYPDETFDIDLPDAQPLPL